MDNQNYNSERATSYDKHMEESCLSARIFFSTLKQRGLDTFDEVVFDRLTQKNPHFQQGGLHLDRTIAFLKNTEEQDSSIELGIDIGITINNGNKTPRNKILAYANTLATLTFMRSALAIRPKPGTSSAMIDVIGWTVLDKMPDDSKNEQAFRAILSAIDAAEKRDTSLVDGDVSLYTVYRTSVERLYSLNVNTSTLKERISSRYPDSEHEPHEKDINSMTKVLTQEAMENRKYGTKPAWIESSTGGAWVFYDGEDFKRKLSLDRSLPIAAIVVHTRHQDLKDIRLKANLRKHDDGQSEYVFGGALDDDTAEYLLYIMHDGSIATDRQGLNDVSLLFRDKPGIAEKVKAEVASNFYDLSMPVYRDAPDRRNYPSFTEAEKSNFSPIEDLLIPRLRYVGQEPREHSDVTRAVREHDVTWFVRTLPPGWHASPEAIAEATKRGLVLEENETFVKEHSRGTGIRKALGYHAIRRKD